MSRIGRKPVQLPTGVEATIDGHEVRVKGPKGELRMAVPPHVEVSSDNRSLVVGVLEGAPPRQGGAMHGLTRSLLNNMVEGVTRGYRKSLDLIGVGYRAKLEGRKIILSLGFAQPVAVTLPDGISVEVKDTAGQKENQIILTGIDKHLIGQVAADLRRLRPPEPYKGKGIRYTGERIRQKAGKAGAR
jgi:large subunit ribosomal protein L6